MFFVNRYVNENMEDDGGNLKGRNSKNVNVIRGARIILSCMVFIGFSISGVVEHGITVVLSPSELALGIDSSISVNDSSRIRRYCDPPNMTAMVIYYDSDEETEIDENYDFTQLQEMFFQTNLSFHTEMDLLFKKFFLWGSLVSPIPANRVAYKIGPKKVFGYSLLGAAASTILVPAAWFTPAHVVIRFFQGFFSGALIPSAHSLAVNWFPHYRRSRFVALYSGKYVGYGLCELLTAKILQTMGSDSIYYVISIFTVIWFILWSMTVFSTPNKYLIHLGSQKPSISTCIKPTITDLPFKNFICSRPVWMSIGVIFGASCGITSVNNGMRMYLKYVYNISNGYLSGFAFILHAIFAISCGYLVDYILETKFVSVTSSRRMFVYVSHFIPAGFLFIIGFVGCDTTSPMFLYSMAIIVSGAVYSGAFCSTIDIAPNYAGTTVALCCSFGALGSLLMSYLLTNVLDGEVLGSWRFMFSLTSLILLVSSIFFMLRGSGSIQAWNDINSMNSENGSGFKRNKTKDQRHSIMVSLSPKPRARSIYTVEKKILKVLHVQQPDKFTRIRAYSTSLPNERSKNDQPNIYRPTNKKRASIS